MEKFQGPDKKKRNLGLALAIYGAVVGAPEGKTQTSEDREGITKIIKQSEEKKPSVEHVVAFTNALDRLPEVSPEEVKRMEKIVEMDSVPRTLQVRFLQGTLKSSGIHYRELTDKNLSARRLSDILRITDLVSTRLTREFASGRYSEELSKYFNIETIKRSARVNDLEKVRPDGTSSYQFCNGFLMRSGKDIYWSLAAHCVKGSTTEMNYAFPKDGADAAVQYVPPSSYTQWGITDPKSVPEVHDAPSMASLSGSIVVSYSWGIDRSLPAIQKKDLKEKAHFSFAMPFGPTARKTFYDENIDTVSPDLKNGFFFLKPQGEGQLILLGKEKRVAASGTSGSVVGMLSQAGEYKVVGNLTTVGRIEDTCLHLCHAVASSTTPESLTSAIEVERSSRVRSSLK